MIYSIIDIIVRRIKMKVTRIICIGVGLASGIAVSWMNRDQQRYNANASGQKFLLVLAQN